MSYFHLFRYRQHTHGQLYFTSNRRGKKQRDLFELTSSSSPGTILHPLDEPPDDTDFTINGGESKGTSFALLQTPKDDEEEEEVREKDEGHLDEHMKVSVEKEDMGQKVTSEKNDLILKFPYIVFIIISIKKSYHPETWYGYTYMCIELHTH